MQLPARSPEDTPAVTMMEGQRRTCHEEEQQEVPMPMRMGVVPKACSLSRRMLLTNSTRRTSEKALQVGQLVALARLLIHRKQSCIRAGSRRSRMEVAEPQPKARRRKTKSIPGGITLIIIITLISILSKSITFWSVMEAQVYTNSSNSRSRKIPRTPTCR